VSARGPDLLFDQVEIIEQPFARRRDAQFRPDRDRQGVAGIDQDLLVLVETPQQTVLRCETAERVRSGQRPPVLRVKK
jgi:hypothetical protein